ncbi:hypothetical protein OH146_00470 [Salinibacterium sp. SYSU T00001]|uniref:hypothetical protein n=1 Tax=Homoserinimonas sedimenticola TaxID=2986805 RepID=UPI002236998E|nr:hypothetical protein [Salinibacterium sedimenticola]MCW4384244.1 hypothetical protein [Salinibacterium sedimenticola]
MAVLLGSRSSALAERSEVREELQARIRQMQSTRLPERSLPLLDELRPLLPEGLRAGATYSVTGSTSLALALLAAPSREGAWCGMLGLPHLGTEAAAGLGIELDRLVLVPDAGARWLGVAAAMTEVLGLVVAAPSRVTPAEASRLAARLRQRESTLIVLGPWPQADAVLRATASDWSGLGRGHGHLMSRRLRVETVSRGGRPRSRVITLPTRGTDAAASPAATEPPLRLAPDPTATPAAHAS